MTTKREADIVEQIVSSLNEREYWGLVNWLASGCNGPLWESVRPWRERHAKSEAPEIAAAD
jgi:hypothetical protein